MAKPEYTHILSVELDALLDTRIATVAKLFPSKAKALVSEKYRNRYSDQFSDLIPELTDEAFDAAYKKRDVETLKASRPTDMIIIATDILEDLQSKMDNGSPEIKSICLEVNIWPYALSEDERFTLAATIAELMELFVPVEVVSIPLEQITYEFIRAKRYIGLIMYNYRQWFYEANRHYKERPQGCPSISLFAPAISVSKATKDDDHVFTLPNGYTIDVFDSMCIATADLIGFTFLPASAFSLLDLSGFVGMPSAVP